MDKNNIVSKEYTEFFDKLKQRVAKSRYQAACAVNLELIFTLPSYQSMSFKELVSRSIG